MGKLLLQKLGLLLLVLALAGMMGVLAGCEGDDGAPGPAGLSAYELAVQNGTFTGTEEEFVLVQAGVAPESCATCHTGDPIRSGQAHQDFYDDLFQLNVVTVSNVAYNFDGVNDVVTFQMMEDKNNDGVYAPFDCTMADALNIYFTEYTGVKGMEFTSIDLTVPPDGDGDRLSIKGTLVSDGAGGCTSTNATSARGDLSLIDGIIVVYGQDEEVLPVKPENIDILDDAHITLARYPFAEKANTGAFADDYVSAANATGCEKCHIAPYFKHGYIVGDVGQGVGDLDFYTCKACHIDNGFGGHEDWQIRVDNPMRWAEIFNGDDLTPAEEVQYAYTTRLMNDVHMSHAMEFPYPQSMANCNTCHSGKLAQTLSDANFVIDTCKSCHPVTGGTDSPNDDGDLAFDTRPFALETILPTFVSSHAKANWDTTPCNGCHTTGGIGPVFSSIHSGYNAIIYDEATGTKYADTIITTIDSVTMNGDVLNIALSATGTLAGLDAADIVPEVLVSFYGWNAKDYIISNHTRDANGVRMEFEIGVDADNALFTTVVNNPGSWEVALDTAAYVPLNPQLATIPEMIADGRIRKAEVAVMPSLYHGTLVDEDGEPAAVGLNAPSVTIDMTNMAAGVADYFKGDNALVSVEGIVDTPSGDVITKGCNSCHDQLATTFHSGNRGGNIVVCRMCHVVTSGGSHLEGQSRSIDSYVHAIHSFQSFDVDRIDFADPVEAANYELHVNHLFPDFAIVNCMACHTGARAVDNGNRAPFDIPDQSKSMPGLLSGLDEIQGRDLPATSEVVVGPAARACGACHSARLINADNPGGLASFYAHTTGFGYRVENDTDNDPTTVDDNILYTIINSIMDLFQ